MKFLEKAGIAVLAIAIVAVLLMIVFSKNGILDYKDLKEKETRIQEQTQKVVKENKKLESEVEKLRSDIDYIKHVAKHEYEMTEKDEMIFKESAPK